MRLEHGFCVDLIVGCHQRLTSTIQDSNAGILLDTKKFWERNDTYHPKNDDTNHQFYQCKTFGITHSQPPNMYFYSLLFWSKIMAGKVLKKNEVMR
ncbi:hypothetical protein THZB04_70060 [Vibrio owensii]|nr:hypothetical protein THZB04_70060 [Vibrio owensii]